MTLDDRPQFDTVFQRLLRHFRVRLKPAAIEELAGTYFKALQGWTLEQVLAAGQTCMTTRRGFPQLVDWLGALPAKANVIADVRWMGADEAREYLRAEALGYEDLPCDCLLCQAANVTDKPLRFVPEWIAELDQAERAFHPGKNKIVTAGKWIHGEDLVRWYAARAHFFGLLRRSTVVRQMPRALELVGASREPGEEG